MTALSMQRLMWGDTQITKGIRCLAWPPRRRIDPQPPAARAASAAGGQPGAPRQPLVCREPRPSARHCHGGPPQGHIGAPQIALSGQSVDGAVSGPPPFSPSLYTCRLYLCVLRVA
ncbi:unnamed protein product [Vitrella brassicaformis CCMP3155]|uniref:Uncharacterized protein n=1 Tax=Vitrella brassicaformis (strain CCMP3155) TaxID=1169540 RepID=A0A0G4EPL0_VITBC|nr:unnamed protein product [Vitrella brassicaformis CCMP3155]|eukprot:CEL99768.1 unnamed protein product [Vitrella brassicaformis CCMP3155]